MHKQHTAEIVDLPIVFDNPSFNQKLQEEFLQCIKDNSAESWKQIVCETKDNHTLLVSRSTVHEKRYKIVASFNNTVDACFDFTTDIETRPSWDEMCVSAKIIEQIDSSTRIQYTKARAIFPLAARDSCNIFKKFELDDGIKMTIAHGVTHIKCPEIHGVVRSEAVLIGSYFEPCPDQPNHCIITQIIEVDPKGWIPHSVIKTVASLAVPQAARKLRKILAAIPSKLDFGKEGSSRIPGSNPSSAVISSSDSGMIRRSDSLSL